MPWSTLATDLFESLSPCSIPMIYTVFQCISGMNYFDICIIDPPVNEVINQLSQLWGTTLAQLGFEQRGCPEEVRH